MRYLNWDVLLFPQESRIPLQEFDVKCHVLPSTEAPVRRSSLRNGNASVSTNLPNSPSIPTLTGFVCSLEVGKPFRVSIHSWEPPWPSDRAMSLTTKNDAVSHEIRVYLDGHLKVGRLISDTNSFPEIIDSVAIRSDGGLKPLSFPPFHSEVLHQSTWNANDDRGRIKIVIAEVLLRDLQPHSYHRIQEVVAFSFQHAPRPILEYSRIAWPNSYILQKSAAPVAQRSDPDAHAHSPTKATVPRPNHQSLLQGELRSATPVPPSLLNQWFSKTVTAPVVPEDPFTDPGPAKRSQSHHRTSTDASMRDYVSSLQHSEMSGVSIAKPKFEQQLEQANVQEILQALSPRKRNALLLALSPPPDTMLTTTEAVSNSTQRKQARIDIQRDASLHPRSNDRSSDTRHPSVESKRALSNTSSTLSWHGNNVLNKLWTENLLASTPDGDRSRSVSAASKRKRSQSATPQREANEAFLTIKGMSTSPYKRVSSAIKPTPETVTIE